MIRMFNVRLTRLLTCCLVLTGLGLLTSGVGAETRYQSTTGETLSTTSSVDPALISEWREALDTYRTALRRGDQVAARPRTQQSAEMEILRDHLRAAGYYNHEIQTRHEENFRTLRYRISPGRRFVVRSVDWDWPQDLSSPLIAKESLQPGQPLVAQDILDLQTRLRREIQNNACYLRVNVRYELNLDRTANAGDIRFYMDPSPQVNISEVNVEGMDSVRPSYARLLTGLEPGQCFQRPRLDRARLNLYESNLFAQVDERVSEPDEDNEVSVTYQVQERFHRTLRLGGGYDTDVGLRFAPEWEHRNFSGRGEHLVLDGQLSFITQSAGASLTIPRRYANRPRITVSTSIERTLIAEQRSYIWNKGINFEQGLWTDWTGNAGVDVRSSWVRTDEGVTDFDQWLSLPLSLVYDNRDNPLNPQSGQRFLVGFTPNYSLSGTQSPYAQSRASLRQYWSMTDWLNLAVYTEGTMLSGLGDELDLDSLSVADRLYAGGGGSVRGWEFQRVPPTDGGRVRVLNSVEQRFRFSQRWGAVAFLDSAWLSAEPDIDWNDAAMGAGGGVRYFTDFAPLRADIASPLDDWGSTWRFYISIGQAF